MSPFTNSQAVVGQVGAEVPVMPAVVPAERDLVAAAGGARNADGDRVRLAAGAREARHVRPRVERDESLGQLHLFGGVQRRHVARANDVECLGTDRARGPEDNYSLHPSMLGARRHSCSVNG